MARTSLVGEVTDELLDRIIAGEFAPDSPVPGELELSARHDVSRMTVREAIKSLQARGILRVERGKGTFVNPLSRWTSLEAVLRATSEGGNDDETAVQLIELRRILETGACELAASRISPEDLTRLGTLLDEMTDASQARDLDGFVAADLAFHDVILHASGNVFLAVLFEPLGRILAASRRQTSAVPEIQQHAITEHTQVITALRAGDPAQAYDAMNRHMQQTLDDLREFILRKA